MIDSGDDLTVRLDLDHGEFWTMIAALETYEHYCRSTADSANTPEAMGRALRETADRAAGLRERVAQRYEGELP
jgi:hypothetical protein